VYWKQLLACAALLTVGCEGAHPNGAKPVAATAAPAEVTQASADRGRYLIRVGGCNDCHTPGFMEKGTGVPESEWLTGVPVGWKGPWGTTYASNLRLFVRDFDEDTFVQVVRARNSRPPMPWTTLHAMSDADLRSLFRYVRSLPAKGDRMPEYVPPGKEPTTAYVEMMPRMPKGGENLR
jgi:mono/diheme cytochrome c family protein